MIVKPKITIKYTSTFRADKSEIGKVFLTSKRVRSYVRKVAGDIVRANPEYTYWRAETGDDSERAEAFIVDYHPFGMKDQYENFSLMRALYRHSGENFPNMRRKG